MKKNIGIIDKVIRLAFAAIIAVLYYVDIISGPWGIVLLILAGILVLTSLISYCPFYAIMDCSTGKTADVKETK